jgi:hypothetical protein
MGGNEMGGAVDPDARMGPDILDLFRRRGVPPTAQNVNRAREQLAAENRGSPTPTATVENSTQTQTRVGKSAPSGGATARDIEKQPSVSSDSTLPAQTDASMSGGNGNTSAPPTGGSDRDSSALLGLLPSAAGIGAAALAARYGGGGGGGGEFIGNSAGVPTGRSMDVPPEPLLPGPRAAQPGAPPTPTEAMVPEVNPLQLALARAIEPPLPTTPQMGGPQMGAPQLQAPGPRAPIAMPDQTSGPTIARPDQRPLMPSAGVQPGPTSPTQVGRTTAPAANPNAIVNPPVDASRARNQIIEYLANIGRDVGGAIRGPMTRGGGARPMRVP